MSKEWKRIDELGTQFPHTEVTVFEYENPDKNILTYLMVTSHTVTPKKEEIGELYEFLHSELFTQFLEKGAERKQAEKKFRIVWLNNSHKSELDRQNKEKKSARLASENIVDIAESREEIQEYKENTSFIFMIVETIKKIKEYHLLTLTLEAPGLQRFATRVLLYYLSSKAMPDIEHHYSASADWLSGKLLKHNLPPLPLEKDIFTFDEEEFEEKTTEIKS